MTPIVQAAAILTLAVGTGAATVSVMNEDIPDMTVPALAWSAEGVLDGKAYATVDTVAETGEVLEDKLLFENGRFQSAMCQKYCDFGWSDYRTATDGEAIHFTATTTCPDAPHTVVWYGTVRGDKIEIAASWTTRRWYWTRQINATGLGALIAPADGATSG